MLKSTYLSHASFALVILAMLTGCRVDSVSSQNASGARAKDTQFEVRTRNTTPQISLASIVGSYKISHFTFQPDAEALASLNFLKIMAKPPKIDLTEGQQFMLAYELTGKPQAFIPGDFQIVQAGVRLVTSSGNRTRLSSILLKEKMTFTRDQKTGILEATIPQDANLSAFGTQYKGLTDVSGILTIRFEPQPAK